MGFRSAKFLVSQSSGQPWGPKTHRSVEFAFQGCVSSIYSSMLAYITVFYLCHDMRKVETQWKPFTFLFFHYRDVPGSEICSIPVAKLSSQYFPCLLAWIRFIFSLVSMCSSFWVSYLIFLDISSNYFLKSVLGGKNSESSISLNTLILPLHRIGSFTEYRPLRTLTALLNFYAFSC